MSMDHTVQTRQTPVRRYALHMVLVGLAVASLLAGGLLEPRPDQYCYLFGDRVGGPCTFQRLAGFPCPQCGMTRSVAWAARGELLRAASFSPGGLVLFLAVQAAGVTSLVQLIRRDERAVPIRAGTVAALSLMWAVLLVLVPFVARAFGYMPLP